LDSDSLDWLAQSEVAVESGDEQTAIEVIHLAIDALEDLEAAEPGIASKHGRRVASWAARVAECCGVEPV